MSDCGLLKKGVVWSSNIWDFIYSKIRNLLITKYLKRDCSIVNNFFTGNLISFLIYKTRESSKLQPPCVINIENSKKKSALLVNTPDVFYSIIRSWLIAFYEAHMRHDIIRYWYDDTIFFQYFQYNAVAICYLKIKYINAQYI
jgi:hypothetical protein